METQNLKLWRRVDNSMYVGFIKYHNIIINYTKYSVLYYNVNRSTRVIYTFYSLQWYQFFLSWPEFYGPWLDQVESLSLLELSHVKLNCNWLDHWKTDKSQSEMGQLQKQRKEKLWK